MRAPENEPRSLFQAFNVVIETMTTTGYGADSPWATPAMNLFVALMQVSGVVLGFVTLRILVIPLFERTPLNLDDRLTIKNDHVVVAEYQRDTEVLLDELEALKVDYVLLESDGGGQAALRRRLPGDQRRPGGPRRPRPGEDRAGVAAHHGHGRQDRERRPHRPGRQRGAPSGQLHSVDAPEGRARGGRRRPERRPARAHRSTTGGEGDDSRRGGGAVGRRRGRHPRTPGPARQPAPRHQRS